MLEVTENKKPSELRFLEHHNYYSDQKLRRILRDVKTFALIGASTVWRRPSYYAMTYLQHKGFKIIPINPARVGETILGEKVYGSLTDVPHQLDMVDIFRNSEAALSITKAALKIKPQTIWMQIGVKNDKAAEIAKKHGIDVIMNRCPKIEFCRLSGELGWAGINSGLFWNNRRIIRPIYKR